MKFDRWLVGLLVMIMTWPVQATQEEAFDRGKALLDRYIKQDHLLVDKKLSHVGQLRRGDAVIFQIQMKQDDRYVVGVAGDEDVTSITLTLYGMRGNKLRETTGTDLAEIDTGAVTASQLGYIAIRLRQSRKPEAHYALVTAYEDNQ